MIEHVVKLGGSLALTAELPRWLAVISQYRDGNMIVVPGGGEFADQVRLVQQRLKFDDSTAHHMALLAMHQYGLMLSGLNTAFEPVASLELIPRVLSDRRIPVWMPDTRELDNAGIETSWDITSDSLSLWLAGKLSARHLVLVKSVARIDDLQHGLCQLVDKAFFGRPVKPEFPISFLGRQDYHRFGGVITGRTGNVDYNQAQNLSAAQV